MTDTIQTLPMQTLPVRIYETERRIMVVTPMPGLEPGDIEVTIDADHVTLHGRARGPHQHEVALLVSEWSVGPYHRDLRLPVPVSAELANATYDNGVVVLCLPKVAPGGVPGRAEIRLDAIESTRGEHVGHVGREVIPTSTREHRAGKHKTVRWTPPTDPRDAAPPTK
jgi:HSP20 family molecular chaperone IbpA